MPIAVGGVAAPALGLGAGLEPVVADDAALKPKPLIGVVIDDVGLDAAMTGRVIALPVAVSISILPYAPDAAQISAAARDQGHEVLVHLPMEPWGGEDPGPNALSTTLSRDEIASRAEAAFGALPDAVGFNNHMGSRFTACAPCLAPVLESAQARDLFAIDSLTFPRSQLALAARRAGAPAVSRDVFVDHDRDPSAIAAALADAVRIAKERGYSVAIAHPHEVTLDALELWVAELETSGVELVPVSAIVERAWPRYATAERVRRGA